MSLRREPSSPSSRRIRTAAALLAVVLAVVLGTVVPAGPASADDTNDWLSKINSFRSSNGLAPLQYDGQLSGLALNQANLMARNGGLSHTPNLAAGVAADWTKLGENVGMGPSTDIIWDAFLNSAPHRGNLLDPQFTHVGIGVVWSGGTQWVTHRFMALGAAPAPTPTAPPQTQPAPEPVYVPPPTAPAPRVVAPPVTVPVTVATTVPVTVPPPPPPEPVVVPAASAPDRAAALLDALYRIER